jgi:hypothetical protein
MTVLASASASATNVAQLHRLRLDLEPSQWLRYHVWVGTLLGLTGWKLESLRLLRVRWAVEE